MRRSLPPAPRLDAVLEPLAFGVSPRVRRAPRHAVSLHRALMTNGLVIGLGLVWLLFAATGRELGVGGLVTAVLFGAPTVLVALHARRRSGRS